MNLLDKSDEEINKIADPLWENLLKCSNQRDYSGFVKDFSAEMLYGANEIELGKQWANNKLLDSLSMNKIFLGCLRRNEFVTILYKQTSEKIPGEYLGRLVIGLENDKVKIFGATIF